MSALIDSLEMLLQASLWVAAVRIATPLIFGTLGELICERAGVLNLGIEGIMVVGALAGWLAVQQGADLWTGVLLAALAGAAFGMLHGVLTVPLALSQHVAGIGVTLLATSLSYYAYRIAFPQITTPPRIQPFKPWPIPGLSEIPILGPALFAQTPLTYLAFVAVAVVAWVLYRTPLGLALRMCGENPEAAEAQGIDVISMRLGAVAAGSALMAMGGAFLTMSAFDAFYFNMVNGRGWICIALVVFASWRPGKALLGALLFAAFDAYQLRLQQTLGGVVPYQVFLMLPYALSILALVAMSRRAAYPRALMAPYVKGERR
jgi:ABC-type uncharacterized transport system permease subunit